MTVPVSIVSAFVPSMAIERIKNVANKSFSGNSMNVRSPVGKCK